MLSPEQKAFLENKESFILKGEVDLKVNELLNAFQLKVSSLLEENMYKLPGKLGKNPFKVNKGNNHKGFPFQVIDFPSSLGQSHIFSFRSVVWYANSFTFNLILKGEPKTVFYPSLHYLLNKGYKLTWDENIWESEESTESILPLKSSHRDNLEHIWKEKEAIKIFKSFSLNQFDDFERLGVECFKDFFGQD